MGERWRDPALGERKNGVDYRVTSEAIEREWLTGLLFSIGEERADSDALLARMRERRTVHLRKAALSVTLEEGGRRPTR